MAKFYHRAFVNAGRHSTRLHNPATLGHCYGKLGRAILWLCCLSLVEPAVSSASRSRDLVLQPPAAASQVAQPLELVVSVKQPVIKVDQDFSLQVHTNQAVFLSVFFVEPGFPAAPARVNQVFPAPHHSDFRLRPGHWQQIPDQGAFFADQTGVENLLVVASRQRIRWTPSRLTMLFAGQLQDYQSDDVVIRHLPIRVERTAYAVP